MSHLTTVQLRRPTSPLTNAEEAKLLRELAEQARDKRLFGFEFSAHLPAPDPLPARAPGDDPVPLHARFTGGRSLQLRYYVVVAQGRAVAEKIVQRFWRSVWPEAQATSREISPEAAFALGARVLLEENGTSADGTSADTERGEFSHVEDRGLLAALLATMAREER